MRLIIDANVLIGELLRERGRNLIKSSVLTLYITERVLDETRYELERRVSLMVSQGRVNRVEKQIFLRTAREIIEANITVVPESGYNYLEKEARSRIPRDPDDWHTVALALAMSTAIWTQDKDFLGCGCPTWTTETLLGQLKKD